MSLLSIEGLSFSYPGRPGVVAGVAGKERFAKMAAQQDKVHFGATIRAAFANRPFRYLIAMVVTTFLVGMLASSMDYYLLVYYVCHGDLAQGEAASARSTAPVAPAIWAAIFSMLRTCSTTLVSAPVSANLTAARNTRSLT